MPSKVTFDGSQKLIVINQGVSDINVSQDLYHEWKDWSRTDEGNKWIQAFRSEGGEPLNAAETQFSPQYFYLMNGWRIFINNGLKVDFRLNLYPDPKNGAGQIYLTAEGSTVQAAVSDSVMVSSTTGESIDLEEAMVILRKLKFNLDEDVIVTLDGEKVSTDDESREKSKANIGALL